MKEVLIELSKTIAVFSEKHENLSQKLDEHVRDETPKLRRIQESLEIAMRHCPESSHIKTQNGKLDRIEIKVDGFKSVLFKWVVSGFAFISLLLGIIVTVMKLF